MKIKWTIILLSSILIFTSCNKAKKECPNAKKATLKDYSGFDGCSWILQLDDGSFLEPKNLEKFKISLEDNKKVWIRYDVQLSPSICMIGDVVNLICITER